MKLAIPSIAALALLAACKPAAQAPSQAEATPSVATTAAAGPERYFYFGNHVPRSVITAIEGVDTASATLTGYVTAQDSYDYCLGMTGGENPSAEAIAQCAPEKVDEEPISMTADCVARTVSDGSVSTWVRDEPAENGKVLPVWQDKASGDIRDYSGAGGGYVLTAAFRLMCPTASANVQPDPS